MGIPSRRKQHSIRVVLTLVMAVALSVGNTVTGGTAVAAASPPEQAGADLGAPDANGITVVERFAAAEQTNIYTFSVPVRSSVHVYVGDLWYDVGVTLWRGSTDGGACTPGAGCLAESRASARRVVQFVQPKTLLETVDAGTYALTIRPQDAAFEPGRPFTLRLAVTPPVCAVNPAADGQYLAAVSITPASPTRASLVTLTAYVLPPYTDLFDFTWSAEGASLPERQGPIVQVPGFELLRTPGGTANITMTATGARTYRDPTDARYDHRPLGGGSLTVGCKISPG